VDPFIAVSVGLVLAVLALVVTVRIYNDRLDRLREELRSVASSRQSLAASHDRLTAQWAPLLSRYPYDPRRFRFVGSPVDGVQFEEDRVVFVEFTEGVDLGPEQQRVRDLVRAGRVEWLEVPLEAPPTPEPAPPATDPWSHTP